jgi:hypothetical protein
MLRATVIMPNGTLMPTAIFVVLLTDEEGVDDVAKGGCTVKGLNVSEVGGGVDDEVESWVDVGVESRVDREAEVEDRVDVGTVVEGSGDVDVEGRPEEEAEVVSVA